jgi:hypothetical protein
VTKKKKTFARKVRQLTPKTRLTRTFVAKIRREQQQLEPIADSVRVAARQSERLTERDYSLVVNTRS